MVNNKKETSIPIGKLTDLFDSIPVDLESDLIDWKAVKKELLCGTK